jgi:hypothetical protein
MRDGVCADGCDMPVDKFLIACSCSNLQEASSLKTTNEMKNAVFQAVMVFFAVTAVKTSNLTDEMSATTCNNFVLSDVIVYIIKKLFFSSLL